MKVSDRRLTARSPMWIRRWPSPSVTRDLTGKVLAGLFWFAVLTLPRAGFILLDPDSALGRLRWEDLLAPAFALYIVRCSKKVRDVVGPKPLASMWAWAFYVTAMFVFWSLRDEYPLTANMVFSGKELEYLLYIVFFALFAHRCPRFATLAPVVASTPIILYSAWQFVSGDYRGFYGLRFPFEAGKLASSEVGGTSALLFVYTLSWTIAQRRSHLDRRWEGGPFLLRLTVVLALGLITIFTLSRSNIAGAAMGGAIVLVGNARHTRYFGRFLLASSALACVFVLAANMPLYDQLIVRFEATNPAAHTRADNWQQLIDYQRARTGAEPGIAIYGMGLGSPNFLVTEQNSKGLTLGVDNQYLRRIFEVGIVGSSLWLGVLVLLGAQVFRASRSAHDHTALTGAAVGLFAAMAVGSIALELFQLIRVASSFYAFLGTLVGLASSARRWTPPQTIAARLTRQPLDTPAAR